jgi:hypothetical protein
LVCSALEVDALADVAVLTGDVTDVTEGDGLGYSVAMSGDRVLLGAPFDTLSMPGGGAAHMFRRDGEEWLLEAQLGPPERDDVMLLGRFGTQVALEGNRAVVTAPDDADPEQWRQGAAYVFDYDPSSRAWTRVARLSASDGSTDAAFGQTLSVDGGRIAIGAPWKSWSTEGFGVTALGAVYVFEEVDGSFVEVAELRGVDGERENFGHSLALEGSTLLIGADGRAYEFERDASSGQWLERARLLPADGTIVEGFGASVALSGDRALVGAPSFSEGHAYVFERQGEGWAETARLSPRVQSVVDFGSSVSIDGERALVGAQRTVHGPGSLFVFEAGASGWSEIAKMDAPSSTGCFGSALWIGGDQVLAGDGCFGGTNADGAYLFDVSGDQLTQTWRFWRWFGAEDNFGETLAVSGTRVLVGASGDMTNAERLGAVYVFDPVNGSFRLTKKLLPPTGSGGDFGKSVALGSRHALVGSPSFGEVFAYDLDRTGWTPTLVVPANPLGETRFGTALALDGDRAVIGAPNYEPGSYPTGAVYVYEHDDSGWVETALVVAPEPVPLGDFGTLVALRGDTLLVGARFHIEGAGAAVFERNDGVWAWRAHLPIVDNTTGTWPFAVALSGDRAFVGGFMLGADGTAGSGVYVFERSGDGFELAERWMASDTASLGGAIATSLDRLLVGAPTDRLAAIGAGAAYVFEPGENALVQTRFDATPADTFLGFGTSLGWSDELLAVGGPGTRVAGRVQLYGDCSPVEP